MMNEAEERVRAWVKDEMGHQLAPMRDRLSSLVKPEVDSEDQVRLSFIRWGGVFMVACCLAIGTCATANSFAPPAPPALSKVEQCSKACGGSMQRWGDTYYDDKAQIHHPELCECKTGEQPIAHSFPSTWSPPHLEWRNPTVNPTVTVDGGMLFFDNNARIDFNTGSGYVQCTGDSCKLLEIR